MRLALRPLRRLSLAAGLAALATLGACSILPEAQVLQVYLLPVHNPPASAAAGGGGPGAPARPPPPPPPARRAPPPAGPPPPPPPPPPPAPPPLDWSLRIARPRTSLVLESPRIAVRPHGDEISVYQGARWSDPAPSLLRDRLMQAFQADGRVRGLSSDDSNLQADFELGGDLRAFQTEYPNGQASALIRYDARLVRTDDKRVVASRRFEGSQPVDGKKVAAVVSAFGKAGDTLSAQVLDWTLRQASAQPAVQP
ncbi:membrane integrity-associated transporter subunit PqiC [Pseudomonas aeruginosa]|nr:membrane integrity-associated transporter subunit PqiC [Pseudomonas aeruginosa]